MSVVGVVDLLLGVASLVLALPTAVLLAEITTAVWRVRAAPAGRTATKAATPHVAAPRIAVVMPAHDEAVGIAAAIGALLPQLGPRDRLLVVADNCSDATADVAAAAGAEVIVRLDASRRGKGYALDFGVRHLESAPPEVVLIVDADCVVEPGGVAAASAACGASGRPVQSLYLMHAPPGSPLGRRIAEFAWLVKNRVRPLGADRLFGACQLMGTGMAFPWAAIRNAPLASGHLVEDMQLGLDLAAAGLPPLFCPAARVTSRFPSDAAGARSQRTRWEHGHLSMITSVAPGLLIRAVGGGNLRLLGLVLDVMVPPLAALVLGWAALGVVAVIAWALGAGAGAAVFAAVALSLMSAALATAWHAFGRHVVSWRELVALPLYIAAKIPVYVAMVTRRQVEWVRTKRDDR